MKAIPTLRFPTAVRALAACACVLLLAGCEMLGIEDPAKLAERQDAEGRAIGAACRHAGRAIEDCFTLNPRALKSAVFAGWKDMNDYMRENKIDVVTPEIAKPRTKAAKATQAEQGEQAASNDAEASDGTKGDARNETKSADAEADITPKNKNKEAAKSGGGPAKHT